jgi:hypothetical protein
MHVLEHAGSDNAGPLVQTGNFGIVFGPFLAHFSAPPRPARAVCCALLGACADRVVLGAWDSMV